MSRRSAVGAPALDPRTTADLAHVGDGWLGPAAREQFIWRALEARSDPVFRLLESIAAAECYFPRLVWIGSDRDDFREVGAGSLLRALQKAYEAGLDAGLRARLDGEGV